MLGVQEKIFKTFKGVNKHKTKGNNNCLTNKMITNVEKKISKRDELLIGWGDWGKKPNALKGCAPTPGIGIRRRFEGWFQTKTINEHMTSQTCPCCREIGSMKK